MWDNVSMILVENNALYKISFQDIFQFYESISIILPDVT